MVIWSLLYTRNFTSASHSGARLWRLMSSMISMNVLYVSSFLLPGLELSDSQGGALTIQ